MNNMKKMIRTAKGFTLIELMIVIAIVAILVALAVPAYRDYTIRAKVAECVNQAAVAKLNISEYRQTVGVFPADENEAGTVGIEETQYCDGYEYQSSTVAGEYTILTNEGKIDAAITGNIEPHMRAWVSSSGEVNWLCQMGGTDAANLKYLPSTCRAANS